MEIPQELDRLLEAQEMETAVHERAHAFLDERIVHLQDQKDVWAKERHGNTWKCWKVEGCMGQNLRTDSCILQDEYQYTIII